MKLTQLLSHPIIQIISFCIIIVGSANFGGPYGFFLYHAVQEGYIYAIIGIAGIVVTLVSLINKKNAITIQFIGVTLMVISLLVFFFSSEHFMNMYAFKDVLPLLTLFLFIAIIALVVIKFLRRYKF
ncbi:hypothetical protein SAMN05444277_108146 [Parafilimonas terrae]|uniref:Uncharacterized protein n=1 Tax=Parafilimonas terrae TaxID=1465490 RepID=A0A1I5XFJ9_9BACT|nr:hypothetical protein SAMN05444277_108146 [Parafilimonas terrae]